MSLSVEQQDYHLTPDGWSEGTFLGDCIGGRTIVEVPSGTVLTVSCYDTIPYAGQPPIYTDQVSWSCGDKLLIAKLMEMYGPRPPWFGYGR